MGSVVVRFNDLEKQEYTGHSYQDAGFGEASFPTRYAQGSLLFQQGQPGRGVFLLRKGRARLVMCSRDGKRLLSRTTGPGSLLGLPASMSGQHYNFTAEFLEDSEVAFVRRKDIVESLRLRNQLCFTVVRGLGKEVVRSTVSRSEC